MASHDKDAQPPDAEVVEGTTADDEPEAAATDLVPTAGAGAIIRADAPDQIIEKATTIANSLKKLIEAQGLAADVGGRRKHVEVGGWQALGTMLGALGGTPVHAETVWTRIARDEDGAAVTHNYHVKETKGKGDNRRTIEYDVNGHDWEARVEVKTPEGVVVGSAEAMCSRGESQWARSPDPAVRSMAETRAESRAYRRAVGWIVNIAGYNPTPKEEMPPNAADEAPPWGPEASQEQHKAAHAALLFVVDPDGEDEENAGALVLKILNAVNRDHEYLPAAATRAFKRLGGELKAHAGGDR